MVCCVVAVSVDCGPATACLKGRRVFCLCTFIYMKQGNHAFVMRRRVVFVGVLDVMLRLSRRRAFYDGRDPTRRPREAASSPPLQNRKATCLLQVLRFLVPVVIFFN
jgi:hypothetical protein